MVIWPAEAGVDGRREVVDPGSVVSGLDLGMRFGPATG